MVTWHEAAIKASTEFWKILTRGSHIRFTALEVRDERQPNLFIKLVHNNAFDQLWQVAMGA